MRRTITNFPLAFRACLAAPVACLLILAAALVGCGGEGDGPPPMPVRLDAEHGTYRIVNGVPVLTLWGTPAERGYTHGKLLAPQIVEMVDVIASTRLLIWDKKDYDAVILPLMDRFGFAEDFDAELRGMLDGIEAALGETPTLKRIGRPLKLADLQALNTVGDWYRQACSSFAAWGERAKDGHVWVGRNFDFMPSRTFYNYQLIIVHRAHGENKAWATVAAPGMIGCITGMNEDGVFAAVHDVFLDLRRLERGYAPRLLTMRRLMERCGAYDLEAQARPILEARMQMFDNAILLAAPVTDGTHPALVFEYNNDYSKDMGVTVRTVEDNSERLGRQAIICTNHFRKRESSRLTATRYRYPVMKQMLLHQTQRGRGIDFPAARRVMGSARLPITIHTVVADLNSFDLWYASGKYLSPPTANDFVKLPVRDWLHPDPGP